jgi:drug/metabolite transporter (DMT)-like permease
MTEPAPRSFSEPRVFIPFLIVTLIWGSTWIVIKDQLHSVPPSWSVTYRFLLGGAVMLIVAAVTRVPIRIGRAGHAFCALLGLAQFVFNFNFVYRAEIYITSGIVAVVFALLFLPNAILSRIFLGQKISQRFVIGSVVALIGIGLLFANELGGDAKARGSILAGIGFTMAGVLSASTANVMMASARAKALPMASMLGWSMLYGGALDSVMAYATTGAPVFDDRLSYGLGILYLGVIASAIAFSLYFRNIRDIGPARAAYSSVLIPVIAMMFSTVFEGYHWTALAVTGSVIALGGMLIALGGAQKS